jgi:hypothetical protein
MTTGSLDSYERGDYLEYAYGSASGRCFAVWHPGVVERISRIEDEVSLAILVGVVSVHIGRTMNKLIHISLKGYCCRVHEWYIFTPPI